MADTTFLDWPFFEQHHKALACSLDEWARATLPGIVDADGAHGDVDQTCRKLVRALGRAGWLKYCVPAAYGGALDGLDVRSLSIIRETLARHTGLADFAFAMQGLGSGAISLFASEDIKQRYLPAVASGDKIAAFALSEEEAGSDAAALATSMTRDGGDYVVNGEKLWISNGGVADFYTLFARTDAGVSAIVVDADTPGLSVTERIDVIAPHPLARLKFENTRVPTSQLVGDEGKGFKAALATLDIFRTTVGAAANRLLAEQLARGLSPLADHPRVRHLRQRGMIAAFDVLNDDPGFSERFCRNALAREILLRPIGNTVYFMPPYVLSHDECEFLVAGAIAALEATLVA
ncbi:MAG: aminotransferase class III-fold pyridoxal phosphate-dependent enzyme [Parvularculaceae bacterium]|nr:aminotransferase class III-fold pyridoxal phosphate-dependent enzyme [Parvularculaceae bacterium]